MAKFKIVHEVCAGKEGAWHLCFQWGKYTYEEGTSQMGYRFIWRRPDRSLQPARGQARIPTGSELLKLIQLATEAGWFITAEKSMEKE